MKRESQRRYSLDEYFAVEETSRSKNEFYNGEIFAMAGASLNHNRITVNLLRVLSTALMGSGCEAFGSDLRLQTPGGLFTYPDVSVICGEPLLIRGRPDTVTNPIVLIEVLSDATREYDLGEKCDLYKEIPTLRDYVFVEQNVPSVQTFHLSSGRIWESHKQETLESELEVQSIKVSLPLREIYRFVFE